MSVLDELYQLNNGVKIPKLGFGTWLIDNDKVAEPVKTAVKLGYRLFDTAQSYGNEAGVAQALRTSGLKRDGVFITSKLRAEFKDYQTAKRAIDESLTKMKLDYLDLILIHAPEPWADFHGEDHCFEGNLEAWRAMEDAYKAGKLRAIGVSNFEQEDLANILQNCTIKPAVNQLLIHISNSPLDLIDYTKKQNILVEAYSPVGHGEILKNPAIVKMAAKYHASPAQLGIRYCLQLGTLPLPKSTTPAHIEANKQIDFAISTEDMEILKKLPHIKDYGEFTSFPVYSGK